MLTWAPLHTPRTTCSPLKTWLENPFLAISVPFPLWLAGAANGSALPAPGAWQCSWLSYGSLGHRCRGEPAAFVLEQIREHPQEQGCGWAASGREQCQRVGSVAFPCSGQGWKDLAGFAVFWLYGHICMEKPAVVW